MNGAFGRFGLPIAAGAAALLLACASVPAPTEAVAVAQAAVAEAGAAGAGDLAPVDLNAARDNLARANAAMPAQDNDTARVLADEADVDARLATAKARSALAKKSADEVQQNLRVLREELARKTP